MRAGIRGAWSVKGSTMAEHDQCLVITFLESTHVLAMNSAEELDEADVQGFVTDKMTLFCASLDNDHTLQARPCLLNCCLLVQRTVLEQLSVSCGCRRGCSVWGRAMLGWGCFSSDRTADEALCGHTDTGHHRAARFLMDTPAVCACNSFPSFFSTPRGPGVLRGLLDRLVTNAAMQSLKRNGECNRK